MSLIFGTPEANALAQSHLEPCPFCGESDGLSIKKKPLYGKIYYCVDCPCGTCGPDSQTHGGAVTNWNNRKSAQLR